MRAGNFGWWCFRLVGLDCVGVLGWFLWFWVLGCRIAGLGFCVVGGFVVVLLV